MIKDSLICVSLVGLLMTHGARAQSDVIISKGAGTVLSQGSTVWMFDKSQETENTSYSRINFFTEPPEVFTTRRAEEDTPFDFIAAVGSFAVGHTLFESTTEDDVRILTAGLIQMQGSDQQELMKFKYAMNNGLALGVGMTDLTVNDSVYIMAYGNAGFSVFEINSGGDEILNVNNNIDFYTFTESDSLYTSFSCPVDDSCSLTPLSDIQAEDPVLFIDEIELDTLNDTSWLYVLAGSYSPADSTNPVTLYRGILGEKRLVAMEVEALNGSNLGEVSLKINPYNHDIWMFTSSSFFISRDRGSTFNTPEGIPENILNRLGRPAIAFYGDTSIVNFKFSGNPGLATFYRDSLLIDPDEEKETYASFHDGGLNPLLARASSLGDVVIVRDNDEAMLVAGHNSQGLFYRNLTENSEWKNLTRQTSVDKGLREVITFPTVYDGSRNVGLGYQLSEDAHISITVFNYAMERVRAIIDNSPRQGGGSRSENSLEDVWDARDDRGNRVAAGMYYILIRSDKGERGWGKVMVTTGKWQ